LQLKQYENARTLLRPLMAQEELSKTELDISKWYLSLTLLGDKPSGEQLEEAKRLLKEIPETHSYYYKSAQKILEQL
jgi:hypothetical protein